MDSKRWQQVEDILDTALTMEQPKRQQYIQNRCKEDKKLKKTVTQLLQSIENSADSNYLEDPAQHQELRDDLTDINDSVPGESLVGSRMGRYNIIDLIGHGGMGSVYLAKRTDGLHDRQVALKVLPRGMDNPSNIARFKREQKILAKLDHPNIAQLLDGGVTGNGQPYLVMEYVDGIPLIDYCDKHELTVPERLELFKTVCRAVQHAHQNTVIHRDLKPSNILVTGDRTVKVLDFGIAKLLEAENPEKTIFETRTGARMFTLGYAAPEQIEGTTVTIAADAYGLGVLLYELLAGPHPLDLEDKTMTEIERMIRKQTPTTPFNTFNALPQEEQQQVANRRNTTPTALAAQLKGDLNAIIMKALRKEPEARYSSAEQLLDDLQRRKQNQPIIAREDTYRYKSRKFFKRHKAGLAVTAGFLLLVIGFAFFYTLRITKERDRAQEEAEKAQQVSAFLTDMFQASNPNYNPEDTLTAATFLKRGQRRINQLNDQPEVQAQLLSVMGRAQGELGRYKKAQPLTERSLNLRKKKFGSSSPEFADGLGALAVLYRQMGDYSKAGSLHRRALAIRKSYYGDEHKNVASSLNDLALILAQQGKYQTADSLYKKALQIKNNIFEPKHPKIATTLNNRAGVLRKMGKLDKAEQLYRQALLIWKENYGDIHPSIDLAYHDLALVTQEQGQIEQADSLYHQVLKIERKLYDGPHPGIAQTYNNLGIMYGQEGHYKEAESYLTKALQMRRKLLGKSHPRLAESLNNLARLYIETGENDKARPLLKEALKIDKKEFGNDHPYLAGDLENLARIEKNNDAYKQAEQYLRESLTIFRKALPSGHRRIGTALTKLGEVISLQDRPKEALPLLRKALKIRKQAYNEGSWYIASSQVTLGGVLTDLHEYNESEELLTQGYQRLKKQRGSSDKYTRQARTDLVHLYRTWGKPALAEKYK